MNERLTEIIDWLKKERIVLSQAEFSEMVGIHPTQISEMLAGKRVISERTIYKILRKFPEVNPDWFQDGEGEMLRPGVVNQRGAQNVSAPNGLNGSNVIGAMHGGQVHSNTGESIERMFTVLVKELQGFHEASRDKSNYIDRQDDYIKKQDAYIHEIAAESYARGNAHLSRIDGLMQQQGELLKQQSDLIRAMIEQDNRIQDRADRIVGMLEKKF